MLNSLETRPADKIIRLIQEFKDDPRTDKIDLGVGVYRDASGLTPIMRSVKNAEKSLWETETTKAYTGIAGDPEFRESMAHLLLGTDAPTNRLATLHTPGGTGAVRQALELTRMVSPDARVWISDPTWPNHVSITRYVGLQVQLYRYFDSGTRIVDFASMMEDLERAERGDIVVLHGCCHNPTGANLSTLQWHELSEFALNRGIVPLVDIAYQGFGDGINEDAFGLRLLANELPEVLIAASCSKNFGVYRERTGLLGVIAETSDAAQRTQSTLVFLNRQSISFPPDHGARLVTMILGDQELRCDWENELDSIRTLIGKLRRQLSEELRRLSGSDRFGFLAEHRGMFSLLGASEEQVLQMRRNAGIYMVSDSRINVAGLNKSSVPVLASAMIDVGL
ncbi:MAG: aspartate/tyrosine/aromatic aminotransferase [Rhodobacteraceae bacterium]|nr:aspartate/tyrosine/aromatic aminotransferase [Paracoccaceae bacterium]MCY4196390.1 aspartate/tyrosine/aromatic aminotransferase [Paracoccaceae bacterium]